MAAHGGEFGGDINRIALIGYSAGANLVAVVAQKAKKEGIARKIKLQIMNGLPVDASPQIWKHRLLTRKMPKAICKQKQAAIFPWKLMLPETHTKILKHLPSLPKI
ncbi:alpha/beta hydrolase [Ferruginibacter sp.]|uniref:alpha/beta hydrolase n=1 Tax=Ferruginibacter sp. TaxID=1940288 RepID=UPI003465C45E